MKFLIDTNVISELRKGRRADPNVRTWFQSLDPDDVLLSVLTVGEIRKGIETARRRDRATARSLDRWLQRLIRDHGDRILQVDQAVAEEWGRLNMPDPIPVVDGLLAATALVHGLTLATRHVKDVARTGVPVKNPFLES